MMKIPEEVNDKSVSYLKRRSKSGICVREIQELVGATTLKIILKISFWIAIKIVEDDKLKLGQEVIRKTDVAMEQSSPRNAIESFFSFTSLP